MPKKKKESIDFENDAFTHEQKILLEVRDRLKKAMDEDYENRRLALEDLEFIGIEGAQWPAEIRTEREADGRPCITTNKMPTFIDQVVGDQRMNRPSIKVIPVDSKADPAIAEILGGWIKHVQQVSKADVAIDHGFEHAVACGYGAMRVITEFVDNDSFDQDARIKKIDNALAVYWGKHSEYDCSDAQYCFIITDMDREEFKETYKHDPMPFNQADSQFIEGWCTENTVRLAEYFVKEPFTKTIYQLEDGSIDDKVPGGGKAIKSDEPPLYINKRTSKGYTIKWYLLSGNKILDEKEWVGKKYIPVIPIWGKELNVGGKRKIRGLIRNAKDPQRMYNYFTSLDTEQVALAPKTPYLATPKQVAGHEGQWKEAHRKNFPYLLVNTDEKAPGWPRREAPPQVSTAMVSKIQMADQEIRDTMGLQKASLGMPSNERSGVAIRERKTEGDVGTFAFVDNLARSIEHLGRVLVDIAPGILDTQRIIRLGLEGGLQKFKEVNVELPQGGIFNDLSIGTYDVVVTVGPSFTTQRTEARQSMSEFIQYYPQAAPLIGDLYAKSMDWPGADEMAERLEFLLPPEIKEKKAREAAERGDKTSPPQLQMPPPSPPDPLLEAKTQEAVLKLEELQIKVEQEKAKLEGLQIDNQMKIIKGQETPVQVPGRVEGELVKEDQPLVGEEGPEVIIPQSDGTVIPNYGLREDGTPKGSGWLGPLPTSTGEEATEISIGVNFDGQERLIPLLVPTLDESEVIHLLEGNEPTQSIFDKAIEHARQRIGAGQSPFKD